MKRVRRRKKTVTHSVSNIVWVDTPDSMQGLLDTIVDLTGPIAIDCERASGIRYDGDKAYLIQIKRENTIFLIDPTCFEDFSELSRRIEGVECVLHAADQDIPCLYKQGLVLTQIFDTEKASRLLNYPKVSLGKMLEEKLGVVLQKLHSQENWSVRPLPAKWLEYAALDVEYLVDLRNALYEQLVDESKLDFALEEFEYCLSTTYPKFLEKQKEKKSSQYMFRHVSGCSTLGSQRALAVVKELYNSREVLAKKLDVAPTILLSNKALIQAAKALPKSREEMARLPLFKGKKNRVHKNRWWGAIARAYACPEHKLPTYSPREYKDTYPNTAWVKNYPDTHDRLLVIKQVAVDTAERINIRLENLVTSKARHTIAWHLSDNPSLDEVDEVLDMCSLRHWQKNVLRIPIFEALQDE